MQLDAQSTDLDRADGIAERADTFAAAAALVAKFRHLSTEPISMRDIIGVAIYLDGK